MNRTVKKAVSLILCAVMLMAAAPLSGFVGLDLPEFNLFNHKAEAATISGQCGPDIYWSLNKSTGELVISGTGEFYSYYHDSAPFRDLDIRSAIISDGIKGIGVYVFWECRSLESLTIPASVTYISDSALNGCYGLKNITVDSANTSFMSDEYGVLFNKSQTRLIMYPAKSEMTSYEIPDSVLSIADYAFSGCAYLKSITIPDSVTSIGYNVFSWCISLESVIIPDSVTSIGNYAFRGCSSLESVIIPDSVTSIGNNAFYGCSSLESIKIPDSVTSIGHYAFDGCSSLESVIIPDSVTSIGGSAFSCFTQIICNKDSVAHQFATEKDYSFWLLDDENQEKTYSGKIGTKLVWSIDRKTRTLTIDNNGAMVSFSAEDAPWKQYISYIHYVKISDGCTNISASAFSGCTYLESVEIPDSITRIDTAAFSECGSLKSVTIPYGVTSIGWSAFLDCAGLESITIPDSVTNINGHTFSGCKSLKNITIPDSVTSIGEEAFYLCSNLESIIIPDSVTSIDSGVFGGCTNLKNVIIGNSVTSIHSRAFSECKSLEIITIPDNVTFIGYSAFQYCKNLKSVSIGRGIETISSLAFTDCPNLIDIYIYAKNCSIISDAITIYATIHGYTGSSAETFANTYGYGFVPIDTKPCEEHTFKNDCDEECDVCGFTRKTEHKYEKWEILDEPTCESIGTKLSTCSVCGVVCKESIDRLPHTDKNDDGICDDCNEQFEIRYGMSGICGPNLIWSLDDEGVLTISGTGEMFNFKGNDTISVLKDSVNVDESTTKVPESTTKVPESTTKVPESTTKVPESTTKVPESTTKPAETKPDNDFTVADTTISDEGMDDNWETTRAEDVVTQKPLIPHPDETYRNETTTSKVLTTVRLTTTAKATKAPTTTKRLTTTAKATKAPTVATTKPATEDVSSPESSTCPEFIVVTRWNKHFDKIKKVVICEGVTTIGDYAFAECTQITDVVLPYSLETIYVDAFLNCTSLEEISIPEKVCNIMQSAFKNCSNLETLYFYGKYKQNYYSDAFENCNIKTMYVGANTTAFPKMYTLENVIFEEGRVTVPQNALSECFNLKSVTIPEGVEVIEGNAFSYCSALESITLPESLRIIRAGAFYSCEGLKSIDIPDSVINIEGNAFCNCSGITEITTPSGDCGIGWMAFAGCSGLTTVNYNTNSYSLDSNVFGDSPAKTLNIGPGVYRFPDIDTVETVNIAEGVTQIPESAFRGCFNLTTVNMPESIIEISYDAFTYCYSLTEITIPEDVCYISWNAFNYCSNLSTLNFNATNLCGSDDSLFYGCPISTLNVGANVRYLPNLRTVETVTFAPGAKVVPACAFSNCTELKTVNLPDSIECIYYRAFSFCSDLESIKLPKNLLEIDVMAFYGCTALKNIELPDSLSLIYSSAFDNCSSLEEINIPDSVYYIGQYAFYACTSVKELIIPENIQLIGQAAFGNCYALESVEFNASDCCVETDEYEYSFYDVFYGCNNISSVEFGPEVTKIPLGLMNGKTKITSVEIPSSVKEIGENAFRGTSLSVINLPDGIEVIKTGAFADIETVTTLTVPESVVSIGCVAFADMYALENVYFNAVNAEVMPDFYSGYSVFSASGRDTDGMTITFGESVEVIPQGILAFAGCIGFETKTPNVKTVIIGSDVRTIGNYAFEDCTTLETVIFGKNVETIGERAFENCPNIRNIELPESIRVIEESAFRECTGLTEFTIPENVEFIDITAFSFCSSLETVNYNAINCDINNYYYTYAFTECQNVKTVNIGNKVESIPSYAFTGCINLEKVYIPDIAINIDPLAFDGCGKVAIVCKNGSYANVFAMQNNIKYILEDNAKGTAFEIKNDMLLSYSGSAQNIVLPSKVDSVGIDAFNGNGTVKSIEIPFNVSSVYSGAFANCPNLEKVIIPFTVTDISDTAFDGTNATIYCYSNSYAHKYAIENGIAYELITVTLSVNSANMVYGDTLEVNAVPSIALACGVPLVWESSDTGIASVDGSGKITANSLGEATISVVAPNGETLATCSVTVVPDEYKVSWIVDGKTTEQTYKQGDTIVIPEVPTKTEYKFVGWTPEIPAIMPAYDLTFTAVFEKVYICPDCGNEILGEDAINNHIASETKVTISDGVDVISGELKPYATITVSAPQVDGKVFSHWSVDGATVEDENSAETKIVLGSGKITITAKYEDCDCKCHQGGIAGFFFKIVLFFQKLFGNNLECYCGKKH